MNKPNILWITFDHQLFYRHGVKRPNYDSFIQDAVSFENAFSVCPLCGPARRSMLNGLYPHAHGTINNDISKPVDETTYFDLLDKAGYEHYYFGKWHAGPGTAQDLGAKGFSPEGYNNPYAHEDYNEYLKRYNLAPPRAYVKFSETDRDFFVEGTTVDLTKVKNLFSLTLGELVTSKESHECFYLAARAKETLKELANSGKNKPFMLRMDFWGPHQPYFPTKEFLDMYDENDIPLYGSFYDTLENKPSVYRLENAFSFSANHELIIPNPLSEQRWINMLKIAYAHNTMCDFAAGGVIDYLKELGLYDNTVVIWTADHGDALGSHGGHMDKNCYLSEEVIRIPLGLKGTGRFSAGRVITEPVSNIDIPVTVADFAGEEFPERVDGVSLKKYTGNLPQEGGREYFVSVTHGHFQKHIARAVSWKNMRYIYNKNMTEELYDLDKDPYEMENLCENKEYDGLKQKLCTMLEEWRKKYLDKEL